ncbi:MAG: hypothetical protein EBR02_01190 [Alphaproteobacteria bacterium]|nr:hypothetical protein [Alphaproteobacteria bacterium]
MNFLRLFFIGILVCGLTSCGTKGRLKTPDQVQRDEVKKAHQAEKDARKKAKKEEEKKAKDIAPTSTPTPTPAEQ